MTPRRLPAGGLRAYVVTCAVPGHLAVARAAVDGGADVVQLRAPELDDEALLPLAERFVALCRAAGVLSIVNDRPGVALAVDADGVHVGRDDGYEQVRARCGDTMIVGISVDSPADVAAAEEAGADYLGVTVWATGTKAEARPAGPDGLRAVVAATRLPVVGIGGITLGRVPQVLAAGAAGVAVVSAVAAAPDPVGAVRSLVRLTHADMPGCGSMSP